MRRVEGVRKKNCWWAVGGRDAKMGGWEASRRGANGPTSQIMAASVRAEAMGLVSHHLGERCGTHTTHNHSHSISLAKQQACYMRAGNGQSARATLTVQSRKVVLNVIDLARNSKAWALVILNEGMARCMPT